MLIFLKNESDITVPFPCVIPVDVNHLPRLFTVMSTRAVSVTTGGDSHNKVTS